MKPLLLVEDNADDIDLTLRAFRNHNIENEVIVARDGVEALDYLFGVGAYERKGLPELPAMVLLDMKLSKMDGLEVLRRIRGSVRTRLLPVVLLTSSREQQHLMSGYSLHANSFISKPINFSEFVTVARELGVYWLLFNESSPEGKSVL